MAEPDLIAPPPIRSAAPKAKMTVYFAMLIISLVAMLFACLFMYLEIRRFGGFGVIKGGIAAVERPGQIRIADARDAEFRA